MVRIEKGGYLNVPYDIIASLKSETMGKLINRILDIKFTRLGFENAC